MAAVAAVTTTLNVGVAGPRLRLPPPGRRWPTSWPPSTSSSEGRLEVGLGAGWKASTTSARASRWTGPASGSAACIEHAAVLKGLLGRGPVQLRRRALHDHRPRRARPSRTRPGDRRSSSAAAAPRLLRWAGATADIVGVNASIHSGEIDQAAAQDALADRIDEKVGWLQEGAGDRFDDLELNAWLAAAERDRGPGGRSRLWPRSSATDGRRRCASRRSPWSGSPARSPRRCRSAASAGATRTTCIPGDKAHDFAPLVAELTGT